MAFFGILSFFTFVSKIVRNQSQIDQNRSKMAQNELKLVKNDLKTTPGGSRRLPNRPPAAPEKKHAKRGGRGRSVPATPDAPRGSFGVQNGAKNTQIY